MKHLKKWLAVLFSAVFIIALAISAQKVFADSVLSTSDIDKIKQNIQSKVIYSNLKRCYVALQPNIAADSNTAVTAKINSKTYWQAQGLEETYLNYPDTIFEITTSSCVKLLTNQTVNEYTSNPTYVARIFNLSTNAELPKGNRKSLESFAPAIGYTEKRETTPDLKDRKCFYFELTLTDDAVFQNNQKNFETIDYCVKVYDRNDKVSKASNAIIPLYGDYQYYNDAGHFREGNIGYMTFKHSSPNNVPQFTYIDNGDIYVAASNKSGKYGYYLDATVDKMFFQTHYNATDGSPSMDFPYSLVNVPYSADVSRNCQNLGYETCIKWQITSSNQQNSWWTTSNTKVADIGSLTSALDTATTDSITLAQLKERFRKLYESATYNGWVHKNIYLFDKVAVKDYDPAKISYEKSADSEKFLKYFLGDTSKYNGGAFSQAERYILYYSYLKNYYGIQTRSAETPGGIEVSWLDESTGTFSKQWLFSPTQNATKTLRTLDPDTGEWSNTVDGDWETIARFLSYIDVEEAFDDVEFVAMTDDNNPGAPNNDSVQCGDEAGALGWILCPTINMLGNTVQDIYDDYIKQNFMEVQAQWLDTTEPLYTEGWAKFRNYANILLAILLLIVILSQVTGIGLTNYGIKKMLPRLVMVAILINLSFFICQIAVDASNILGYSIQSVLAGMGADFTSGTSTGGGALANILSIGGLVAAGVTMASWLPPLLLALLTSLISVAFAGVILGVRQAGVLILVVISPLAFACYALDGTKSLFDKWKKLFIDLLVVFPVCGLLMGGGIFASDLLLTISAGFFMQLVAMLLRVVPFFFIPALVKGALATIGNIGTKIGMFGRGLRGSATRVARNSDLYQRADANIGKGLGKMTMGAGKLLRKVPGVDNFTRSRVGQALWMRGHDRRMAKYIKKDSDLAYNDANARAMAAGGFLSKDARAGIDAAANKKIENQGIEEQMAYYRGREDFDTSNPTTLSNEIARMQALFDKKPDDVTLRRKIKALTKFMLESDPGRGELFKTLHSMASNNANGATVGAMNTILEEPENMGAIKRANARSLQGLSSDITSIRSGDGGKIKSVPDYALAKLDKFKADTLGDADIAELERIAEVLKGHTGAFDRDTATRIAGFKEQLLDAKDTNNPAHNKLSDESLREINKILSYIH